MLSYYNRIEEALAENRALWQATIIETTGSSPAKAGMKACIGITGEYFGNLGGGELEHGIIAMVRVMKPPLPLMQSFNLSGALADADVQTNMICGGSAKVFIEPLHLAEELYIFGAGHCGRALAELAIKSGYFTHLIDNRPEQLELFPEVQGSHKQLSNYEDIASLIKNPQSAWVVIMTHGHLHDKEVLEQCLELQLKYLGMIGSSTKVAETFKRLRDKGIEQDLLDQVHAPIGLPIGSQTPHEISISIMAELISIRRNRI